MSFRKSSFYLVVLGFALVTATGCSGKNSSSIVSPETSVTLNGIIQLAPVKNEKVSAYKVTADGSVSSSASANGTSGEDGSFSLTVPEAGHYVIKTEGSGKHVDEASKVEKDAVELTALVDTAKQTEVPVTPISTLHQERALEIVASGKTLEEAMTTAKGEVASKFDLQASDLEKLPVSPYSSVAPSSVPAEKTGEIKVAEALAIFSYFIKNFSLNGLAEDEKLTKVMAALRADFKNDGKINGNVQGDLKSVALKAYVTWGPGMENAKGSVLADGALVFKGIADQLGIVSSSLSDAADFNPGETPSGSILDQYYVNGHLAQLSDGAQDGIFYNDGEVAHGFMENECYVNGIPTLSNGSGPCLANNKYYFNGQQTTLSAEGFGFYLGVYYVDANPRLELDSNGDGYIEGLYYHQGRIANATYNGVSYIDGVQAVYVNTPENGGSDANGDGTQENPFSTPQKAFEVAYTLLGKVIIKLGVGEFGGVNLNAANANEWPNSISVRGVSVAQSNLGGINADAVDSVVAPGKNVHVDGNQTTNLGNITSTGGLRSSGGSITITNSTAQNLSAFGGAVDVNDCFWCGAGSGGTITLNNSFAENVSVDGGAPDAYWHWYGGGSGGSIVLNESTAENLSAQGLVAFGGTVSLTDSNYQGINVEGSQNGSIIFNGLNRFFVDGSPFSGVSQKECFSEGVKNTDLVDGTGYCSGNSKFYYSGTLASVYHNEVCYSQGEVVESQTDSDGNILCGSITYKNGVVVTELKSCREIFDAGFRNNGVYQIMPSGPNQASISVYCDLQFDGGGYTLIAQLPRDTSYLWNEIPVSDGSLGAAQGQKLEDNLINTLWYQDTSEHRMMIKCSDDSRWGSALADNWYGGGFYSDFRSNCGFGYGRTINGYGNSWYMQNGGGACLHGNYGNMGAYEWTNCPIGSKLQFFIR